MVNIKTTDKKRKLGWIPDVPDHRDYMYSAVHKSTIEKLKETVDLRKYCSKVEDQGNLGSCTANALVGNLEFLEIKDKSSNFLNLSRLFVYYNERVIENTINHDSGAMLRDGIKALNKQGACSEILFPYIISKFKQKPNQNCYKDGLNHLISKYIRLNTVEEMKMCLSEEYPFVFGFSVYDSFETEEVATTGIVPMPTKDEQMLGGHAVLAVGYDTTKKIFHESIGSALVRNSWGDKWGISGYFWIPFEYLADRNLSDDFWTIIK